MEYRVLARKYRPVDFDHLIGQEVLVQTLSNAIKSNRIAHAFLLTGIRGVGKTTTARIIARALNCIGVDGKGGATISPCGVCSNCTMISEDRHMDVLEMDAASHTGVDDVRELIDSVRYLPTSARYKIYIIDEVHMLSNSAFNALLKTLEEPPPHVKFIFATTEARKIPVTILSRCQRFDLKRVSQEALAAHLGKIAGMESITAEAEALALLAVAAEGSVRDSLSLLDQAIARSAQEGGTVNAAAVRQMIGAADNTATFRLLETLFKGDVAQALVEVRQQYADGSDPLMMVQDALAVVHLVTRVKVSPTVLADVTISEHERTYAQTMAEKLSMPVITRLWQMLLKGVSEVRMAPTPLSALEMLMVRIAYAAQLPTPADVIRSGGNDSAPPRSTPVLATPAAAPRAEAMTATASAAPVANASATQVDNFEAAVALFAQNREPLKHTQLVHEVRLVRFAQGTIELEMSNSLPRDFAAQISACLTQWTNQPWKVVRSEEKGAQSLHEVQITRKEQQIQNAATHPLVSSVFEQFPGAKLMGVKAT